MALRAVIPACRLFDRARAFVNCTDAFYIAKDINAVTASQRYIACGAGLVFSHEHIVLPEPRRIVYPTEG